MPLPNIRLAHAGEFTQRAFLNDKMDLAQAEGVADLIEAATESAAKARCVHSPAYSPIAFTNWCSRSFTLRMLVEATLDFPEEEIDFLQKADAFGQLDRIQTQLGAVFALGQHRCAAAQRRQRRFGRPTQCRQIIAAQCNSRDKTSPSSPTHRGHDARYRHAKRFRLTAYR